MKTRAIVNRTLISKQKKTTFLENIFYFIQIPFCKINKGKSLTSLNYSGSFGN